MRREFSRKTKRLAWDRANGQCEGTFLRDDSYIRCTAPIDLGRFVYDHIIPDWQGGDNSLDNCQVICAQCNRTKTAQDQYAIAKVKRIQDRATKALTSKRPMPFGRGSKLKRKMDGTIVER